MQLRARTSKTIHGYIHLLFYLMRHNALSLFPKPGLAKNVIIFGRWYFLSHRQARIFSVDITALLEVPPFMKNPCDIKLTSFAVVPMTR